MGRPQFQQVVTQVPGQSLRTIRVEWNDIIPAGVAETYEIYSPPNVMTSVVNCLYLGNVLQNASDGTYQMSISPVKKGSSDYYGSYTGGVARYDENLSFDSGVWTPRQNGNSPLGDAAQIAIMKNMKYTEDLGLEFRFWNNTNGDTTANDVRYIILTVHEEQVK